MKKNAQIAAIKLRHKGLSLKDIALELGVAKSSVSIWVRDVQLSPAQLAELIDKNQARETVEKRRQTRLKNEKTKRDKITLSAQNEIDNISRRELWLMGVMLYWAEGGKTQRMVRFSNSDPNMILIMMRFFRDICDVPERKFRGYIHIHPHLDYKNAEKYWSSTSKIPVSQFFKTYRKKNISSKGKKDTLPNGVFDIYVMDTRLFLRIKGWSQGIFEKSSQNFIK